MSSMKIKEGFTALDLCRLLSERLPGWRFKMVFDHDEEEGKVIFSVEIKGPGNDNDFRGSSLLGAWKQAIQWLRASARLTAEEHQNVQALCKDMEIEC